MLITGRMFAVGMVCIAMLGSAAQISTASETMRIVHTFSAGSQIHSELADLVPMMEAETNYSVRFEVYSATELDVVDSIMLGKFEGIYDFVLSPANVFASGRSDVNFLARTDLFWSADIWKEFKGSQAESEVALLFEKDNLELIGSAWIGSEHLFARKSIDSLDDLKGIKMRTRNPFHKKLFEGFGVTTVSIDWRDTYTAMEKGVIDATVQPIIWSTAYNWGTGRAIVRNPLGGYVAWLVGATHWRDNMDAVSAKLVKSVVADSMVVLGTRMDDIEKARLEEYTKMGWAVKEWNSKDVEEIYGELQRSLIEELNPEEKRIAELIKDP